MRAPTLDLLLKFINSYGTALPKGSPVKFLMNRKKVRIGGLSEFARNRNRRKRSNSELLQGAKRTGAILGCAVFCGFYFKKFLKNGKIS